MVARQPRVRAVQRRAVIGLAQLSDTHLVADPRGVVYGHNSAENMAAVVGAFESRPDVAVITGDVAEDGSADAYRTVRSIVSDFAGELHVVAGNHDDSTN